MSDTFSKKKRSEIMRSVRSNGNKSTEQKFLQILQKHRIKGWRRNYPVQGRPDFVFIKFKIAIFLDGCFWHGHECKKIPKSNREYWVKKISRNQARDIYITKLINARGWVVIRLWECELKSEEKVLDKLKFLP